MLFFLNYFNIERNVFKYMNNSNISYDLFNLSRILRRNKDDEMF